MGALDYLGAVTPSTRQIAAEVVAHLDSIGKPLPVYPDMKSQVIWGYNAGGAEHGTGRALDFMVQSPANGVGDAIADYMFANADRFGLIHVIWRQRIRSTRTQPGVWRPMSDRGSPTENHMDHPHCYFDGRAIGGSPVTTGGTASAGGSTDIALGNLTVKQIQELVGVTVDGIAGPATVKAVKELQAALGVTADGLVGTTTEGAVMSLQDDIAKIATDVKKVKTDVDRVPQSLAAHRVPLSPRTREATGTSLESISIGGALQYVVISAFTDPKTEGMARDILAALEEQGEAS